MPSWTLLTDPSHDHTPLLTAGRDHGAVTGQRLTNENTRVTRLTGSGEVNTNQRGEGSELAQMTAQWLLRSAGSSTTKTNRLASLAEPLESL